jgi:hypothetical protein
VRDSLLSDLGSEQRAKPVPPKPDRLMANVDPALGQKILDVAQRQRVLTYIIPTRRITFGELLKYRSGSLMARCYHSQTAREFGLTTPGIVVSYETVRRWVNHFGPMVAADLRKRRPKPHWVWHLDEVYLKIGGRMVYLWRAVDAEGEVLDVLAQAKRNRHAALRIDAQTSKEIRLRAGAIGHGRLEVLRFRGARSWT